MRLRIVLSLQVESRGGNRGTCVCAEKEEQPDTLKVVDQRNPIEENVFLCAGLEFGLHILPVANWDALAYGPLAVSEIHLAKFWPVTVGLHDPRLLASPRKQVENDLRDSRPASSPNELGCGRAAPVPPEDVSRWGQRGPADRHTCRLRRRRGVRLAIRSLEERSAMLSEGAQHGHEGIALLTPSPWLITWVSPLSSVQRYWKGSE